jgi:hypothetical protein
MAAKSTLVHHALGGVQAAEPVADRLVEHPVVHGRGLPAHAAEQPDGAHLAALLVARGRASGGRAVVGDGAEHGGHDRVLCVVFR